MSIDPNIKLNIIIVDDSEDDHFFIIESLKSFKNLTFKSFYNGAQFWHYLEERVSSPAGKLPDIVILDINMPKLNGFEVFRKVKEAGLENKMKFLILTSNLTDADLNSCAQLDIDCYKKPFTIEAFGTLLTKVIKDEVK